MKSRCQLLDTHIEQAETMNKHLKVELEHYQEI